MSDNERRNPGVVRLISGATVDLSHAKKGWFPEDADFRISDIAWGLGRLLRYNGHIRQDYTVAHHSIIMSFFVPKRNALEALLHDAAEAYIGDIIWPVKALSRDLTRLEDVVAGTIMQRFGDKGCHDCVTDSGRYIKSEAIQRADLTILWHEHFLFDRPGGEFNRKMHVAWTQAAREFEHVWSAPQHAFIERYNQLTSKTEAEFEQRQSYFENVTAPKNWYRTPSAPDFEDMIPELLDPKMIDEAIKETS